MGEHELKRFLSGGLAQVGKDPRAPPEQRAQSSDDAHWQ